MYRHLVLYRREQRRKKMRILKPKPKNEANAKESKQKEEEIKEIKKEAKLEEEKETVKEIKQGRNLLVLLLALIIIAVLALAKQGAAYGLAGLVTVIKMMFGKDDKIETIQEIILGAKKKEKEEETK